MGEYLLLSDVHATRRPPSSCTPSYWPDLRDLLWQTVAIARERQVHGVIWAGDVLHHKAPGRTDHGLMQDLIKVIQAYRCPVWIVPGNHDIQHDRLDSIEATQPLGVLYLAGAHRLEGWADDGHPLYGVPWLQDWGAGTLKAELASYCTANLPGALVATHAPIYPPGQEPRYDGAEFAPASWWADALGIAGHVFYGHIHEPHGTWQHQGVTFCNNGALSRGSLDEHNLHRQVGCTIWDDQSGAFKFVPLAAKPAAEVFRLREHGQAVTAQGLLDGFLAAAGQVTLGVLSVDAVLTHFRELGLGREELALAEEFLMAEEGGAR